MNSGWPEGPDYNVHVYFGRPYPNKPNISSVFYSGLKIFLTIKNVVLSVAL